MTEKEKLIKKLEQRLKTKINPEDYYFFAIGWPQPQPKAKSCLPR